MGDRKAPTPPPKRETIKMTQRIQLGMKVRDVVTGFEGIVIGYHSWMTGCDSVSVQPTIDKDGKERDSKPFDVIRLEVLAPVALPVDQPAPALREAGGPHDQPGQTNIAPTR